jgi:hypothetical protein
MACTAYSRTPSRSTCAQTPQTRAQTPRPRRRAPPGQVLAPLLHDRACALPNGWRLERADRYRAARGTLSDAEMAEAGLFAVHPAFRVVALAEPPATGDAHAPPPPRSPFGTGARRFVPCSLFFGCGPRGRAPPVALRERALRRAGRRQGGVVDPRGARRG